VLVHARCSNGCRLRAELRVRPTGGTARASRVAAVTSRRVSRNQTLSINAAKRIRGGARRLRIKVTAIGSNGQIATRWRTLRVRG
jgi:hypothetical protein